VRSHFARRKCNRLRQTALHRNRRKQILHQGIPLKGIPPQEALIKKDHQ
jgi:hypothetical protein